MGVAGLADGEGGGPVFEGEGPRDRDGELAGGGALGEFGEDVVAQGGVRADAVADAEFGGGG